MTSKNQPSKNCPTGVVVDRDEEDGGGEIEEGREEALADKSAVLVSGITMRRG